MPLREPAPAKLNLALHVRRRRDDGYHELETLFAFCIDGDVLTGSSEAAAEHRLVLDITGPFGAGLDAAGNLVERAWQALKVAAPPAHVRLGLDKRLPVASGLGGGSADAAAALRLLTSLWKLDPAIAQEAAPALGADVPACLLSMSARGEGVGEKLSPVPTPELAGAPVLLVNPLVPLSTPAVFKAWDGGDRGPLGEDWRRGRNDLEPPARDLVPAIGEVLEWLGARPGVDIARMSGSGASCFALFADEASRDTAAAACPDKWWHLATHLR
ncbi:4-(cytidine 5'-diphospho)-2-C-methyl-D-erythritol kinase [Sphingomicrobium aestuariivivum]|uniref:4-(cytidine 5'-diphospho)-2-C-methyl-D-erythritol kinase n=1 Tax=Sphingomicrobium aestuariivivum TaxID=1582356 RepID=UPI001FD6C128|nr:4-(cytidine 5'-diphospho)-2-C-methyl-D-erythritol kinase [Sphingomicrobium aestuariivivum]MCJ8189887.1 4-(cytidine 5'-diphospho)-2-C-methyl-D-erythritol kinase [Sphingomicrobium aestuariivivum]